MISCKRRSMSTLFERKYCKKGLRQLLFDIKHCEEKNYGQANFSIPTMVLKYLSICAINNTGK